MENSKNILKDSCLFRMVMKMVVFVTLFAHSFSAYSQVGTIYPVEINAMLTPPYGTCLTDYVGSNRFQCNVLMRDMHATGYKFYIFMTVKDMASGRVVFSAQSDKHTITPGMPTYMAETGVFAEFFKPENILVSTAYKDGCLKEGSYNFVFQVVDARDTRRIPISKECVFPARLVAGGAPLLISPFTGTNIECGQTFVNFTWQMPIVTGEQTKYLIEICPTDEGGNGLHYLGSHTPSANGVGPSQGYIRATSYMPMYQLLESAEKKFVSNTTYFWRVSIIDEFGNVKPNSTSEIDSFTYCYTKELEPYTPLKEPKVKAINGELDTVHIDTVKTEDNATNAYWILDDVRFKYQSYALDVRKKSQDTWTTYYIEIKEGDPEERNYYGLSNLKYNELYEARMQYLLITEGDTSYAPYSDTIEFKVPNPMDTADCGEIMAIKDCNGEKGRILKKYDTLYANGTPVVLDSIIYKAGDSTVISGFGVVSFPILRNFKLKMKFNEVSVNCYGELISGQVVSVYNESTGAIIDLNHLFGNGDGGGSQSTNERPDPTKYNDKNEAMEKMSTGDYAQIGDSIYTKDKDGNLVALGKPLSLPADKYTNNNNLDDDDVYCIFRNDTKDAPNIGFDADEKYIYRKVASLRDHYQSFSKQDGADNPYIIPYVASNPGRVVKLSATLEGRLTDEYDKESVKFIMPMSGGDYLDLNAKKEGDKYIVDFPGGKNPDTNSDVYAVVKKGDKYVNVGKINIETYAWRKQKVKIVPVVNDYSVEEKAISETLNRIYGRFGITYEVTRDDKFEMIDIDTEFLNNFSVGTGILSKQSDDMKRLQGYYKKARDFKDSTAYLFLLNSAKEFPSVEGDMPQGQICGYIFMHSNNGTLSDGRLVAHELAHGIYKLDHVFEPAYGITEKTTDNLLDYNNGDQLAHFQWELIKHPGFAWAIFESDEDNMFMTAFHWLKNTTTAINTYADNYESKVEDIIDMFDHVAVNSHSEKKYFAINGTIKLDGAYNYISAQNSFIQKNGKGEVVHKDNIDILSDIHNEEKVVLSDFKKNNVYCIRTTPNFDDSNEVGKKLSNYFAMMNIYSFVDNPVLSNYKISKLDDLKNNKRVRAGYRTVGESYGLIAFYDESGNLQVVLQLYSPTLGCEKSIETWVEYLLLSKDKTSDESETPSEKKEATQPKNHFMVKDPVALVRKDASPHKAEDGKTQGRPKGMTISKGTEVTIIDKDDANKVKQVQYVDDENKKYWTGEGNLEEIKVLDKPEDSKMSIGVFVKLPYVGDITETQLSGEMKDLKKIAVCGDYFRMTSSKLPEFGSDKDSKGYWTYDWETIAHMTAEEIAVIRPQIAAIKDQTKKESAFLKLQTKVEYHNQRNNESIITRKDGVDVLIGDVMCNITCSAMALEMLGLSNICPDIPQFEDCIETYVPEKSTSTFNFKDLKDGNKYDDSREHYDYRKEAIQNMYPNKVTMGCKTYKVPKDKDSIKEYIINHLKQGDGVIVSYGGHFIKIVSCDDDGYVYDDPYGKYSISNTAKNNRTWNSYNSKTTESAVGEGCVRKWSDFDILTTDKKFYIEYYHAK